MKQVKKSVEQQKKHNLITIQNDLIKLIVIIAIVTAVFLIFYGITLLVEPKGNVLKTEPLTETIQYDEILVGQILNRSAKEYYVLVKNMDNSYNDLYLQYLEMYNAKNSNNKYYYVDLSQPFNQSYLAKESVVKGNEVSSFKFSDTTLVKVKNKKIDKVYATQEAIITALEKMI